MSDSHESGWNRWSRRKAQARSQKRGAALPETASAETPDRSAATNMQGDAGDAPKPVATAPESAENPAHNEADPDLPSIEELDYDSDYAQFLSPKVSDGVRKMALRRLWRSNPILANVDGLVDYDDDFTDAATVVEGLKSVYQVGRGMLEGDSKGDERPVADATTQQETTDSDQEPMTDDTPREEEIADNSDTALEDTTEEQADTDKRDA